MSPPKKVSMNLRKQRAKRRMSQAALATKAGFSREYIARLETGHHDPSLSTLTKLARALGVPLRALVE